MEAQIFSGTNVKELSSFLYLQKKIENLDGEKKNEVSKKGFMFLAREKDGSPEEFLVIGFCGEDVLELKMKGEKTFHFSLSRALIMKNNMIKAQKGFPPEHECSFSGSKLTDISLSVRSSGGRMFGAFTAKE